MNCGSSTADETDTDMNPVGGSNGDADNGGGNMTANGTDDGDDDAGTTPPPPPPPPPAITGMEPECIAAFTRLSECYLSQSKCSATAKDSAMALGAALAPMNCAPLAMQAGGLAALAAQWNAQTACDAPSITGVYPSLDMNAQIKGLCEAVALTKEECTSACTNFATCKDSIPEAGMARAALGMQASCETNCTPANASIFRCGLMAGPMCTAVGACFAP